MPSKEITKKQKLDKKKLRRKAFIRQWVIICLEQSGHTNLIPKEENVTSADYLEDRKTYISKKAKDEK